MLLLLLLILIIFSGVCGYWIWLQASLCKCLQSHILVLVCIRMVESINAQLYPRRVIYIFHWDRKAFQGIFWFVSNWPVYLHSLLCFCTSLNVKVEQYCTSFHWYYAVRIWNSSVKSVSFWVFLDNIWVIRNNMLDIWHAWQHRK